MCIFAHELLAPDTLFFNLKRTGVDFNNIYKFHGIRKIFGRTRALTYGQTDKLNACYKRTNIKVSEDILWTFYNRSSV